MSAIPLSNAIRDGNCLNSEQITSLHNMGLEPERQADGSWLLKEREQPMKVFTENFYDGVITICSTRYGGAYEKCQWVAFSCGTDQIEAHAQEAFGEDGSCQNWWDSMSENNDIFTIKMRAFTDDVYIGRGNTPQEAHDALMARHELTETDE